MPIPTPPPLQVPLANAAAYVGQYSAPHGSFEIRPGDPLLIVANGRNAGSFGYGSAVAVVMFLISLAVALVYQRFVLRRDTDGALTGGSK